MHNASQVHVSNGFIDGSTGRDGLDLVNCRHVRIDDSRIEGSDDALCLKTINNGGLGRYPSHNITVVNTSIGSTWCNGIQLGSATEVDMYAYSFRDVRIGFARKAALSIVSMDGAHISNVNFTNITIAGADVATPIFVKLGNRAACEDRKGTCAQPGSIRDITFSNVSATGWGNVSHPKPGHARAYTATIEGLNASYRVGPLRLSGLTLDAPGGGSAADALTNPPISPLAYQPRMDDVRPAYGLFMRYARDVTITASSVAVTAGREDGRPAMVADSVEGFLMDRVRVGDPDGSAVPCQVEARNSSGNWTEGGGVRACVWTPSTDG